MLDQIAVRDVSRDHPFLKMVFQHMGEQYIPKVTWDEASQRYVPRSEEEIAQLLRETVVSAWTPGKADEPVIEAFLREVGCNLTDYRLKTLPGGSFLRNEPPNRGTNIHQDNTDELTLTTIVYLQNTCKGGSLKFYESKGGKATLCVQTRPQIPATCRVVTFPSKLWHRGLPIWRAPGGGVQAKAACVIISQFERAL